MYLASDTHTSEGSSERRGESMRAEVSARVSVSVVNIMCVETERDRERRGPVGGLVSFFFEKVSS